MIIFQIQAQAQVGSDKKQTHCILNTLQGKILPVVKDTALWLPRQQKRYWSEVLENCIESSAKSSVPALGCAKGIIRRITLVPRTSRNRTTRAFLAINPMSWPFTLPPEILRTKYAFSLPVISLGIWADTELYSRYTDKKIQDRTEQELSRFPGVAYVNLLNEAGLFSSTVLDDLQQKTTAQIGREKAYAFEKDFLQWTRSRGTTYLPRMSEFRKLEVIENDAQAQALNQLAFQVAGATCSTQGPCKVFPKDYAEKLDMNWKAALAADPIFSKLSPEKHYLLEQYFTPNIKIGDHSDLDLMAQALGFRKSDDRLRALKPIASSLDPISLVVMSNELLSSPENIDEKRSFWKNKVDAKGELPSFVNRPDIPAIAAIETKQFDPYGDGKSFIPLKEELSYWKLLWTDPRFHDIQRAYQSGELSELDSLQTLIERIQSYNDFFKSARTSKGSPATADLCKLASLRTNKSGKSDPPGNPLFTIPVENYSQAIQESRNLNAAKLQGCQIEIAEFLARLYLQDAAELAGKAEPSSLAARKKDLDLLLSNCPKSPRVCPPSP
jgi:hypothetical protein